MTVKRFTMKGSTILENGEEITAWDCYDLLNELHLQNKRLKEKIQRERNSFRKTRERWSKEVEDKIKELSEENEQLKEDNKILNRINDKVNGWNGLAHDKIFKLEKENEQLKKDLIDHSALISMLEDYQALKIGDTLYNLTGAESEEEFNELYKPYLEKAKRCWR